MRAIRCLPVPIRSQARTRGTPENRTRIGARASVADDCLAHHRPQPVGADEGVDLVLLDRLLGDLADKTGVVAKYYCIGREEMPDRVKMFVYPDYVYSYDIRLDDGNILRGIPEPALALV